MIKANELRMGNIVYAGLAYDDDGENERPMASLVLQVFQDGIWWANDLNRIGIEKGYNHTGLTYVNPIPLTEEWLERLEFQYGETIGKCADDKNDQAWSKQISNSDWLEFQVVAGVDGSTRRPTSWPEWRIVNEFSYIRQDFWGQPKYVHQLQNLFHALTGEELTITQ